MPNIFITDQCDRGCRFCFARVGPWSEEYPKRSLTHDEIIEILEVKSSLPFRQVGIVGGEPLGSPFLVETIDRLWRQGTMCKIFTSGSCPFPDGLADLRGKGPLNFIVNIDAKDTYTPQRREHLDHFLKTFGKFCSLSFTILDPDRDLSFLLDYISEYGLVNHIRMGVALPIVGLKGNEHLPEERYRSAGRRFVEFAKRASERGVILGCDCGFVACMFDLSELGLLMRLGMKAQFVCGPAMDIGPGLEVWHCFPLSRMPRVSLREYQTMEGAEKALRSMAGQLRARFGPGIFPRCRECKYLKRGQCSGGCLGLIVPSDKEMSDLKPISDPAAPERGVHSCPT
jgi:sulfatase maturation enzyme AslB (radical SAM superfamily)